MTASRPWIVATLPARSVERLRREARSAAEAGADLAEIRVDRIEGPEATRLEELFPAPLPLIATLRSRAEGGEGPDRPEERRELLARLARLPFRWIDLEIRRDRPLPESFPDPQRLGRIYSCHPGPAPPTEWDQLLEELNATDGIGKLVVPASVEALVDELLPRLERTRGLSRVVHTTGPSGPILRALSGRLGFPLVYASLPEEQVGPAVEPSQIPVAVLRSFLDGGPGAPLFAVVGHPVERSRSPSVHQRWMREEGRTGLYLALDFADERAWVETLPKLLPLGFRGLNVTHPYKRAALEASDRLGAGAAAVGACNTLTLTPEGAVGENTDLSAMLRRLSELRSEGRWDGGDVTVLGAGGAARATLAAARELRVPSTVYARTPEDAETLAREFGARPGSTAEPEPAGLVVHATPVGGSSAGPLELPLVSAVRRGGHVLDWVYAPLSPTVRTTAESAGATYEDGWALFVYQAAASFALWWGAPPDERRVREALEAGPCTA